MTILVVDDEPDYRLVIRSILSSEGHAVVLAEDGVEALEKLEEGEIDLVIADIYMPRMDGIKFHRKVRSLPRFERLPFLFVSAFDDQHTMSAVKDPRFDGFLKKGRPIEELLEWVNYLALPEDKRPKVPPSGLKPKPGERSMQRGASSTPIY
jgi:CheY-like chemotaxis protein